MEYFIVAIALIGYLFYQGVLKVPKIKLSTGAAAAAPVAKKGFPAAAKMMIALTVIIILLLWGDQLWQRMDGVWKGTSPGAALERSLGAGWSNALWLLLLIPFAFFLNGKGATGTAVTAPGGDGKLVKMLPNVLMGTVGIAALWYGYHYFTNSGNVVVDLWYRTSMVINMPANKTLEIRLPPGGCSADYNVTMNWRIDYDITGHVPFMLSSTKQNYIHYVTVGEPLRSKLITDGTPIEIKVDKIGC